MVTRDDLIQYNEKELLIQLRMAVAVLEERTANMPSMCKIDNDIRWLKRVAYTALPLGPLAAGIGTLVTKLTG